MPFKSEWVEYPDIAALYQKYGVLATEKKSDGSPHYTLPLIHDESTGRFISGSTFIAKYLDETYPDTPKLFHPGTDALIRAYDVAYLKQIAAVFPFVSLKTYSFLNARSVEHFQKKLAAGNKELEGDERSAQWAKVEQGLAVVDSWWGKGDEFVMGDTLSFADIITGSWLVWVRTVIGEEDEEWKQVTSWQDGRWGKLLKKLDSYQDSDVSPR